MKTYSVGEGTELNYDLTSDRLKVSDSSTILNFDVPSTCLVISNTTLILNIELRDYDESYAIYQILLDWIEAMSVGDIF